LAVATGERRARLTRHEQELGEWTRARRPPGRPLGRLLTRELLGYQHSRLQFGSWLEPPRPELTLMIDLEGAISANGSPLPDAWIGGLSRSYTIVGVGGAYGAIDLKLNPLGAYSLLGFPLSELTGACVPLGDALGPEASSLVARLHELEGWDERFDTLEEFLAARLAAGPVVDPAVAWAWRRLCESAGRIRVEALAAEVGASRRYLLSKFRQQIGLAPKTVARQLRFADVRQRIERAPLRWSEIAYEAGYADQSHLNREFRDLAGTTPTDFVARRIPEGGLVGDGCAPVV
jgi:AraC-like DNA-binding protein